MTEPLWTPSPQRVQSTNAVGFMAAIEKDWGSPIADFSALHRFSTQEPEKFWLSLKDFGDIIGENWPKDAKGDETGPVLVDGDKRPGVHWFPQARLNFAENLLRRRDETDAIVFRGEDGQQRRLTHRQLYDQVSRMAQALAAAGVEPGDRVAAFMPNIPETIIAMLAAVSLGATWSSTSPDFGVQGVLDRFGQIEPKILIAAAGYHYNGKTLDSLEKITGMAREMPSVEKVVVVPYTQDEPSLAGIPHGVAWEDFMEEFKPGDIAFKRLAFNHPLYILYSSGTTGPPKCIVHGAGGSILQHTLEHRLHCDIKPGDRVFYFTTCGWMMWNWLAATLAAEATLILYDGSPFYPDGNVIFDIADACAVTLLGTSAKFLDAAGKAGIEPLRTHRLDFVRLICSTGSPLAPEGFDYVYEKIKADVQLASICGGTDILGCFMAGDPTGPVWRGEIQSPGLGMAIHVFDEEGNSVTGGKGELVCANAFPSMPTGFWNDPGDDKYRAAYFGKYPGVWCHGDWIERTEHGGFIVFGRSDATLNPGGVRIGTAEIYRQVERLDEVEESIVIGQQWDADVRVVLFVVLRGGLVLDDALIARIKDRVRQNCTPRHVPAKVIQVTDIPRTKSGKITELAVRDVVHGRRVKNKEALANPQALDLYRDIPELAT